MTINNGQTSLSTEPTELVDRVRRAHGEELEELEADSTNEGAEPKSLDEAERQLRSEANDPLERRLISTARSVLDEQPASDEIGDAVVDAIVDAKYEPLVEGQDRQELVGAVKETLANDGTFEAAVENMLIQAARRLGRARNE